MSLKSKTIGALSWSLVQEVAQRGLQLAIGILLARMLLPAEFGLVAMLSIFIAVAQALVDSGFGSALIQRQNPTEIDKCSVFYFNLLIGIILASALCLAAPVISNFYQQPQLLPLTQALSVILVINSLAVVQNAMMVRDLDFKRQTIISAASTGISGVVGLAMAWRGFGVWSLVAQQIGNSVVRAWLYWVLGRWRPALCFSFTALKEMFGFGSGMVAASILSTLFDNLYSLVIGRLFSANTLGYFNRAQTLQVVASQSLGGVSNRVTFPVFSQLQNDRARLRSGFQKALTTVVFVQFPIMLGLAAIAKPLILFLLTDKWAECIPMFQLLCFGGLLYPVHLLNLNVLLAVGRSDLFFRLELIKKVMIVLNVVITYRWGVQAMVLGMVLTSALSFFVNAFYTKRFMGYSIPEQIIDLSPYLLVSTLMGLIIFAINLPLPTPHVAQLGFKVLLGVAIYAGISRILKLAAFNEILSLIRTRLPLPSALKL